MQLPAALIHGAWLWKLGVPALVAVTVGAAAAWRASRRPARPLAFGHGAFAVVAIALT